MYQLLYFYLAFLASHSCVFLSLISKIQGLSCFIGFPISPILYYQTFVYKKAGLCPGCKSKQIKVLAYCFLQTGNS